MFRQIILRFSRVVYVLNWHIELCFRCFGKAFYAGFSTIQYERTSTFPLVIQCILRKGSYFLSCGQAKKDSNTLGVDAFCKKGESLVRCERGLNINYAAICMVQFTYFNSRLLTYPKIYMFNFVCDQYRFNLDCFFFSSFSY